MSVKEILERYRTIAVVGLSSHPWRASYSVSRYMQNAGYRIIPVNPLETEVLSEKAYPTLDEVPEPFEIVDIFRRPEYVPDIVEAAIRRGARVVCGTHRDRVVATHPGTCAASRAGAVPGIGIDGISRRRRVR